MVFTQTADLFTDIIRHRDSVSDRDSVTFPVAGLLLLPGCHDMRRHEHLRVPGVILIDLPGREVSVQVGTFLLEQGVPRLHLHVVNTVTLIMTVSESQEYRYLLLIHDCLSLSAALVIIACTSDTLFRLLRSGNGSSSHLSPLSHVAGKAVYGSSRFGSSR